MGTDIVNNSKSRLFEIFLIFEAQIYATTSKIGGGGKADTWTYGGIDDYKLLKRDNL